MCEHGAGPAVSCLLGITNPPGALSAIQSRNGSFWVVCGGAWQTQPEREQQRPRTTGAPFASGIGAVRATAVNEPYLEREMDIRAGGAPCAKKLPNTVLGLH